MTKEPLAITQPTPEESVPTFNCLTAKITSRCDIDCDYCYEFPPGNDSWRAQPRFMPFEVFEQTAVRYQEYLALHGLHKASIVMHGGEPLLAGPDRIDEYAKKARSIISCHLDLGIQF